jgi:hypothetical protein
LTSNILIYSELITSRQEYIFSFFFNELFGINHKLTNDYEHFKQSTQHKFIYSRKEFSEKTIYLKAHPLLFESEIRKVSIDYFESSGYPAFFKSSNDSFFPFDIFAASFYLISRYEEYLDFEADKFGRFRVGESIAFKHDFLEEPIIDIWSIMLKNKLLEQFPTLRFKTRKFSYLSTIDIDNAYAHLHKGIVRTSLSVLQSGLKNPQKLIGKIKVLLGLDKDPYDNYDFLDEIHKKYTIETIYFILFSKYGKYDKNPTVKNKQFRKLIKRIGKNNEVGLHPSFQSNYKNEVLISEKNELEKLIEKKIEQSRQHFLMLKLPDTYENLIKLGITKDYSMGYSSHPGFRAGTCTPFYFFNLKTNEPTNLRITPFAVMDVCFRDYLKCSPSEALKKIKKIITSIKKVNGLFVSLWHNESLESRNQHFTWRHVYEGMLDEAKDRAQTYKTNEY